MTIFRIFIIVMMKKRKKLTSKGLSMNNAAVTVHAPPVNMIIIVAFTAVFLAAGTAGFVHAEKNR
jgi:predicted branched-subunit amino acid permease